MYISSYTTIYFFAKNFFLSNVYISVNTIFECSYLFFDWVIGHPLSTYATGGIERGPSKMCTGAYWGRGEGVEKSVIRYVRTKWMALNKCCGRFFVHCFSQVHLSFTASKENGVVFFHQIILSYAIIRI